MSGKNEVEVLSELKEIRKLIDLQNKRLDAIDKNSSYIRWFFLSAMVLFLALYLGSSSSSGMKSVVDNAYKEIKSLFLPNPPCQQLSIYRYGKIMNYTGRFNDGCTISQQELLAPANSMFPGHSISIARFLSFTGRDLPPVLSLISHPMTIIGLGHPHEEHFMWPTVEVGYSAQVELGEELHKVTVTTLAASPRVFRLDNMLTSEECDHLYQVALNSQEMMAESKVGADTANSVKSVARSSRHTWIGSTASSKGQWATSEIIDRVNQRILDLVRLPFDTAEPFQVVFYNKSDYYYGHHDYTDPRYAVTDNPYYLGGGNRYITVLLYLNDVEEGGHTVFPFADANGNPQSRDVDPRSYYHTSKACDVEGLKVLPRKGGAAMFYNLEEEGHMEGKVDQWSLHAGCKPTQGPKYISNKWIRNKRVDGKLYDKNW